MIGCTRCGRLHTDAEKVSQKRLSCTEVKKFWAQCKAEHRQRYGHYPMLTIDDDGKWACLKCGRQLVLKAVGP